MHLAWISLLINVYFIYKKYNVPFLPAIGSEFILGDFVPVLSTGRLIIFGEKKTKKKLLKEPFSHCDWFRTLGSAQQDQTPPPSKGDSSGFSAGNPGLKESAARLQPQSLQQRLKVLQGRTCHSEKFLPALGQKPEFFFLLEVWNAVSCIVMFIQHEPLSLPSVRFSHSIQKWDEIKRLVVRFDQVWSFSRRMCENQGTERPVFFTVSCGSDLRLREIKNRSKNNRETQERHHSGVFVRRLATKNIYISDTEGKNN